MRRLKLDGFTVTRKNDDLIIIKEHMRENYYAILAIITLVPLEILTIWGVLTGIGHVPLWMAIWLIPASIFMVYLLLTTLRPTRRPPPNPYYAWEHRI